MCFFSNGGILLITYSFLKKMEFKNFLQHSKLGHKQYQEDGVSWITEREKGEKFCKGGIIADEMGLGKTIMIIGNLIQNFCMPNLIVLPVVLVEQWKDQFIKTTGHIPFVYHGTNTKIFTASRLQHIPIILTTYGTLLSDYKKNKNLFRVEWKRIIFDEAHHLRNRQTKVTKVVRELKSEITWLITGTPIQNHINDIYSLFEILKIDKKEFIKSEILRELVDTIVLKRTKAQVGINLPDLTETRIETEWTNPEEKLLTEDVHENIQSDKKMMLAMMLYERMMCVLPNTVIPSIKKIQKLGLIRNQNFEGTKGHSKMDSVIQKLVERKDNGNKKIVFSNFHGEIDYLKNSLTKEGLIVEYIDGRVSKRQRKAILGNIVDVLIIQIKTGSEGLNLQNYNEVYFVTPDWNPQTEQQAIARCHRIGQTKKVEVFRFVMSPYHEEGSNIEMYSEQVQVNKREIEKQISSC